tara:strand:+ start:30 stop:2489 length:2460 start_codon:yes stop_codon:yes gene_type:complete
MVIHARNLVSSSTDRALGGAEIERSLRFNRNDSAHLTYTPASASSDRTKITISVWVKKIRANEGEYSIFHGGTTSNDRSQLRFYTSSGFDNISWAARVGGSWILELYTTAKFRDCNAWYHLVARCDTTNGTANIYVNGVEVTDFTTSVKPSGSQSLTFFNNVEHQIGERGYDPSGTYFHGYMAEMNVIQGQALDASYFGYTDFQTGIWRPKRYEGTYGDGFYLDFSDNSSTSTIGIDKSPNGNDFTANNFSVSAGTGNDSLEDTPTNNFPTFNHLNSIVRDNNYNAEIREGGLLMVGADVHASTSLNLPKSGKWYVEFSKYGNGAPQAISVTRANKSMTSYDGALGLADHVQYVSNGEIGNRTRGSTSDAPTWQDDADIVVAAAVDMDNGAVYFARANTWINSGDPTSGSAKTGAIATDLLTDNNGEHYIGTQGYNGSNSYGMYINFGQRPFTYTPPTGYKTLNSKNLPTNSPSIIRPQKHFNTLIYTGNGSNGNKITGLEFKPDLVWFKCRSTTHYHDLYDSVRGANKRLIPNSNSAENSYSNLVQSFNEDGVTLGTAQEMNQNSATYVAWCWKAGGSSTVSNTDGDQTTQVSLNEEAGFGIVTYTGTGSNTNIGHGLGAVPEMIITKSRSASGDWAVLDKFNTTAEYGFFLNDNGGYSSYQGGTFWNDTPPTSTVFRVSTNSATNASGVTYVAYCWKSIPGFSKIGKYTGNGNTRGTYVYLGFRPAWVMVKRTDTSANWHIWDNKRDPDNPVYGQLNANLSNAEVTGDVRVDFLSNGFKHRNSDGGKAGNYSGGTYIYMAFAEQPGNTAFDTITSAR